VKVGNFAPKDPLEGREKPEHGAAMGNTNGTSISEDVSTRLKRIADLSRQLEGKALLSLAHHIDVSFLRHAYALTRKDGAPGVDDVTAEEYERELEGNLERLLNGFKSGTYKAPPVRRTYIPKADGGKRPLGIPTLEDSRQEGAGRSDPSHDRQMAEGRSAGGWKDPFSGGRIAAGRSDLAALGEHLPA
jgi:hypothetical protein